jgi:4-hydroxy-tetrahydrodipicolinate synthase
MESVVPDLHGLMSAMSTPMTEDGSAVDENSLRELTERTINAGVHGLVPCGSTGEFAALTGDERRKVVEIVLDQTAGRVPVVPHVGAMSTYEAIAHAKHAESAGAAGLMSVAPYYEPLSLEETKKYFLDVAGAVGIPIMVYNLPVATGVNLEPAEVAALARQAENIKYVKDTSGDFSQAAQLIHDHGDVVKTFVGWDTLYLAALVEGGAGSVNGAANFIAPQLVDIYDNVQAGKLIEAKATWDQVFPLMEFLVSGGYVAAVKAALRILGYPAGSARQPIGDLPADRRSELEQILKSLA